MNIFSKVQKKVSDTLAIVRASGDAPNTISSAGDTVREPNGKGGLPDGFFRVKHIDGKVKLGYKFPPVVVIHVDDDGNKHERKVASPFGHSYDVQETFRHPGTGETIKLNVPRAALPVFNLNLRGQVEGVITVGGFTVMDTESQADKYQVDGNVGYDGVNAPLREGLELI
jgi:hypothetical protein